MFGTKKKSGPGVRSMAYNAMAPAWTKADAVLGGTETMRAMGRSYMPQHVGEEDDRYVERLNTAVLWNQSELTLNSWASRPFSRPIKFDEDVPEELKKYRHNIDLQGTDLHVFAQNWFREGVAKALSHVFVDMPRKTIDHATLADDITSGGRPYWNAIAPERVIAARALYINGVETLVHLRIYESTTETDSDGYSEISVQRIREYNLVDVDGGRHVEVTVWRMADPDKDFEDEDAWDIEDQFQMDIDVIPLVTFYSNRLAFMYGKSPLMDLYDMNIQHWQSDSDQNAVLTIARFPILAMSGADPDQDLGEAEQTVIGPYTILRSPEAAGRVYYVEHSGQAIGAGRESLLDLRERMSSYGASFLKKAPGRQTATARALDSAESQSALQAMAIAFQSSLQTALEYTAKWLGIDFGGAVELHTEFNDVSIEKEDLKSLNELYASGTISREALLSEYKRRGALSNKYDIVADKLLIEGSSERKKETSADQDGARDG